MSGLSPIGPLIAEHRLIERMVADLRLELDSIAHADAVDPAYIDRATDFIRTYADRCHHGKEEDILFRTLAEKPLDEPLAALMQELIQDHVYGRALTRRLTDANRRYAAGEPDALSEISETARALVGFYPVHIEKEDRHFFKPCLEYLSAEERDRMLAEFHDFDRALIHEKYRTLVEELESARS